MIVVPTYNEKENIGPLVAQIRKYLPDEPVLFVDDNSPDGTAGEITRLAQGDRHISLLMRPRKLGLGSAYREVFIKAAAEGTPAALITMDADLSHPASALPAMVAALREFPVVIGSRYIEGGRVEQWHWYRRAVSWLANLYARVLCGVAIDDLTSGYVGYRTEVLQRVPLAAIRSEGYAFQIEMKLMLHRAHALVKEIPITYTERREGKSKLSWHVAWEAFWLCIRIFIHRIL